MTYEVDHENFVLKSKSIWGVFEAVLLKMFTTLVVNISKFWKFENFCIARHIVSNSYLFLVWSQ